MNRYLSRAHLSNEKNMSLFSIARLNLQRELLPTTRPACLRQIYICSNKVTFTPQNLIEYSKNVCECVKKNHSLIFTFPFKGSSILKSGDGGEQNKEDSSRLGASDYIAIGITLKATKTCNNFYCY